MNLRYLKTSIILGISFIVLFGYNNCQPIGQTVASFDESSLGGPPGGGGTNPGPGQTLSEGKKFFLEKLTPMLETNCNSCHNEPRLVTGIAAPLTIYNYTTMRDKVQSGNSSIDNYFINKSMNIESHAGGARCSNGALSSPCKEISEWVSIEFPLKSAGYAGQIKNVSALGRVTGYAFKPSEESNVYQVTILDAPVDQGGQIVAQIMANEAGMGVGQGHHFSFDLPLELRDGVERNMYIYVDSAVAENLLPNMPYKYAAYSPRDGGSDFYNNNVNGALNRCNGCHAWDYQTAYPNLLDPTPYKGGTNLTNIFIRKANGELSHGGGSFCGGDKNSGLCASIRDWWNFEFGQ